MNPDKVNSRIIIPISSYEEIMRGYPIDMFLYANNYEAEGDLIEFFSKRGGYSGIQGGKKKSEGNHIGNRNCGFLFCKSVRTGTNSRKDRYFDRKFL